jgi:hypothetical protein
MNIYLDIDGTLIHEDAERAGEPAEGLADFIRALFPCPSDPHTHTSSPYSVFWLTTHCMDGDPIHAQKLMKASVPAELHGDIDRIRPTRWSVMKTEAIDFTAPFIWFDNDVTASDRKVLKQKALMVKQWLIEVDLVANPHQLLDVLADLR